MYQVHILNWQDESLWREYDNKDEAIQAAYDAKDNDVTEGTVAVWHIFTFYIFGWRLEIRKTIFEC